LALELHRLLQTDGNAFSPPADVLVDDEGVTVHKPRRIEIAEATG
jgi:hypothetical protein